MNKNVNKDTHAKAQNEMKSVKRGSTLTIYIKRCTLVNWRAATPCEHRLAITLLCRRIMGGECGGGGAERYLVRATCVHRCFYITVVCAAIANLQL